MSLQLEFDGVANAPEVIGVWPIGVSQLKKANKRILFAEDDELIREVFTQALMREGFVVDSVADGEEAWIELQRTDYDLLITDNEMPQLRGIELIARVRQQGMELPVIVASGSFNEDAETCERLKISAVLSKPCALENFVEAVRGAVAMNAAC